MPTINAYKSYFFNVAKEFCKVTGASVTVEELQVQFNDMLEFEMRVLMANESQSEDEDDFNNSTTNNDDNQLVFNENTTSSERQAKFDLKTVLDHLFYTSSGDTIDPSTYTSTFSVDEDYISNLTKILHSTKVQTVANYFTWRLITIYGQLTTKKMTDLQFEFQKVKFGLTEQVPKGERCGASALAMFNKAISSKYLEINRDYNAKVKDTLLKMVEGLSASFQDMLSEAKWIDDRTEKAATAKLKAIKKFVSYPNWMFDQNRLESIYEDFNIVTGDYFSTTLRGWGLDTNRTLIPLQATPNANSWRGSLLEANAYYYRTYNSLTIAAGIVQPPFYRNNCLESLNYGGIGTTIGHEIGHGFDVSGSHYDSAGNWHRWGNSTTLTEFLDKVYCFVQEYSELKTEVGPVNGLSTVNENIADNVGVRVAFRAYQNWIEERNGGREEPKLPGLEMFTSQQLFFLGFANKRCETATKEYLEYIIHEDTHSPDRFRVILPLQNFKEFSQHWNCPVGSPMNPPPKDQCVLW